MKALLYSGISMIIPIIQTTRCTCYLKLFIIVRRSTCFGRSFRPSSGAQNCVSSNGICQRAAATCCSSPIAADNSSCLTYTVAVYAVLSSSFCLSSGAQNCVSSNVICQTAAATCCSSPIVADSSSCLTYTVAVYAVLSS